MLAPPDLLSSTPEIFPHTYDPTADAVYLVRLTEAELRAASFLDQRVLPAGRAGAWAHWGAVEAAAARLPRPGGRHFIFHISHVGSTLLSRLLGADDRLVSLREPAPLRPLAQMRADLDSPESLLAPEAFQARLAGLIDLWSRVWRPGQTAVIKATSIACALAGDLLAQPGAGSALLMYVQPEAFLASILAAPNSPMDIRGQAQLRLRRLHARLGRPAWRLWELTLGEMIAMSWACEMIALMEAARGREGRVKWIEFDRFLAEPATGLADGFRALGVEVAPERVRAIIESPIMRQYSKAPEHAYDGDLRREVLRGGRAQHGGEIRRGLDWLDRAARDFPEVEEVLAFAKHAADG